MGKKSKQKVTANVAYGFFGTELPLTVELCGRIVDNGFPCLGVLYRPQPDQLYCYECGAAADHENPVKRAAPVKYIRTDKMSEMVNRRLNTLTDMANVVETIRYVLRNGRMP